MKVEPKEYISPDYREIMEYVEERDINPDYLEIIDSCMNFKDTDSRKDKWLKILLSDTGGHFFSEWMWDRWKEREKKRKREERRKGKKDRE